MCRGKGVGWPHAGLPKTRKGVPYASKLASKPRSRRRQTKRVPVTSPDRPKSENSIPLPLFLLPSPLPRTPSSPLVILPPFTPTVDHLPTPHQSLRHSK